MNRDDLDRLADECTSGLRDDPELRLDVRCELRLHLDDAAAAARTEGKTDAESLAHAAKAFGSPVDVADALLAANRRRMRLRALARLAVRGLLVPAAVAVAAACVALPYRPVRDVLQTVALFTGNSIGPMPDPAEHRGWRTARLTADQRLILSGDPSRPDGPQRQRAIWEAHPDNRVFYANYVTALFARRSSEEPGLVERELLRGQKLEPDNGRYRYLLGALWLESACAISNVTDAAGASHLEWTVRDRARLDRAMAEVLAGAAAPYARPYARDMLALRLSLLPEAETLGEEVARIGMAAGVLLPDCSSSRSIARASILYARLLAQEGRRDEALRYLQVWEPLSRSIVQDGFTLIEMLVAAAVVNLAAKDGADAAAAMGAEAEAAAIRERAGRAGAAMTAWRERVKRGSSDRALSDGILRHGSVLAGMLMPALGEAVPPEQLAPSRQLEYTILERGALAALMVVFLALMLFAGVATLVRRVAAGPSGAPMLLLPRGREAALVVLVSAVLPVLVYYLYSRYCGLAAREWGWRAGGWRLLPELWALGVAVLSLAVLTCARFVHRRCSGLAVAVPRRPPAWLVLAVCAVPLALPVWLTVGRREHAAWRGALTRALVPAFAAVTIAVAALGHPYLAGSERRLVRTDPLLSGSGEGFTRLEADLVKRLKAETLAGFERR